MQTPGVPPVPHVGGPILPPELSNIIVIPIAPHQSMDRAVVLSEGSEVRLQAFADYRPMLTVDGQGAIGVAPVELGDTMGTGIVDDHQIATINPREPGSQFWVEFLLPEPVNQLARCHCEVVWQRRYSKEHRYDPGMGLRFLDLPSEMAEAIDDWVRELERERFLRS